MEFRIADSLARLSGEEQKVVKTTAFDLQLNPVNPGMQFHHVDRSKQLRWTRSSTASNLAQDDSSWGVESFESPDSLSPYRLKIAFRPG